MFMILMGFSGFLYADALRKNSGTAASFFEILYCLFSMATIFAAIYCSRGFGGRIFAAAELSALVLLPLWKIFGAHKCMYAVGIFTLLGSLIPVLMFACISEYPATAKSFSAINSASNGRVELWKISVDMLKSGGDYGKFSENDDASARHILFGRGEMSFAKLAGSYFYNAPSSANKDYKDLKKGYQMPECPHSSILHLTFEFGVAGFVFTTAWLFYFFIYISRRGGNTDIPPLSFGDLASAVIVFYRRHSNRKYVRIGHVVHTVHGGRLFALPKKNTKREMLWLKKQRFYT